MKDKIALCELKYIRISFIYFSFRSYMSILLKMSSCMLLRITFEIFSAKTGRETVVIFASISLTFLLACSRREEMSLVRIQRNDRQEEGEPERAGD